MTPLPSTRWNSRNPLPRPALRDGVIGRSGGPDARPLSCFSSSQAAYPSFPPKRAKTRSLRSSASSHRTRFAGLLREPWCPPQVPGNRSKFALTALAGVCSRSLRQSRTQRLTGPSGAEFHLDSMMDHAGAGLFFVILRVVHILPQHLLRKTFVMRCGPLKRAASAVPECSSGYCPGAIDRLWRIAWWVLCGRNHALPGS